MATSLLASLQDINTHLPVDKAQINDAQDDPFQIDVFRTIRARLSSTFTSTVINSWTTPATTPEIIRSIAGRLIAALFYATLVAEDEADGSVYAQGLYNSAMADLEAIRTGNLPVIDVDGTTQLESTNLVESSFYPNASAGDPLFQVGQVWS